MSAVTKPEPRAANVSVPMDRDGGSITELLRIAVERGTPVAELKELVALHDLMARREAERAFSAAMAAFQRECPSIKKTSTAKIPTKTGGQYSYTYAELDEIARTINPILAKYGLSYSWDSTVDKDTLTCLCTVRHADPEGGPGGHSITSKLTLPVENPSAMNAQQKVGAALTFAQRRSLSSALGLTTTDEDSEAAPNQDPTPIDEDQLTQLQDMLDETKANRTKFLAHFGIELLEKLPAIRYNEAMTALRQLAARRKEKGQ